MKEIISKKYVVLRKLRKKGYNDKILRTPEWQKKIDHLSKALEGKLTPIDMIEAEMALR